MHAGVGDLFIERAEPGRCPRRPTCNASCERPLPSAEGRVRCFDRTHWRAGRCLVASDQVCAASLNGGGPRISMPPFFFAEA